MTRRDRSARGHGGEYRLRPMRLEGKTALVTGGASGIGAATARRLAAEGARVAIGDLNEDGRPRRWRASSTASPVALDVADAASVRAGVARPPSALGPIDVLVNNAGTDRFAFFVNTDEELWDFVLGVNLRGVLAVTHAVLPGMQERRARRDRQRRQRGRPRRLAGLGRLLGRQGRRDRLHQGDRARGRALPRALQRGRARARSRRRC